MTNAEDNGAMKRVRYFIIQFFPNDCDGFRFGISEVKIIK